MSRELDASALRVHFLRTYMGLRLGLLLVAVVLPLLLWWGGLLFADTPLLGSMSAYYHSGMRNVFVGALFALGALLITYKGFSGRENWALNFASVFLVGVALVPTGAPAASDAAASGEGGLAGFLTLHGTLAVLFFLCMGYVCLFRAGDTLALMKPDRSRPWHRSADGYRVWYRLVGALLLLSPVLAAVANYIVRGSTERHSYTFWLEAMAVWAFSLFWLLKSWEVGQTNAEQLAASGKLKRTEATMVGGEAVVQVEPDDVMALSAQEAEDVTAWMSGGGGALPKS